MDGHYTSTWGNCQRAPLKPNFCRTSAVLSKTLFSFFMTGVALAATAREIDSGRETSETVRPARQLDLMFIKNVFIKNKTTDQVYSGEQLSSIFFFHCSILQSLSLWYKKFEDFCLWWRERGSFGRKNGNCKNFGDHCRGHHGDDHGAGNHLDHSSRWSDYFLYSSVLVVPMSTSQRQGEVSLKRQALRSPAECYKKTRELNLSTFKKSIEISLWFFIFDRINYLR